MQIQYNNIFRLYYVDLTFCFYSMFIIENLKLTTTNNVTARKIGLKRFIKNKIMEYSSLYIYTRIFISLNKKIK
jgi:hypothetical protein